MEQDINKHNSFISNFKGTRLFIVKLLAGITILAMYINSLLPQYAQGYNASLIDKVERLESISKPKIVLLGNSNVAFGIDSRLLEDEIGMPVVNMGLHGGLGNAFHEEIAKLNVTPGDIYIICHSHYVDNNKLGNPELTWIYLENHFPLWRLLRQSDIIEMAKCFPVYLKKSLMLASTGTGNQIPNSIYARAAFNEYGDIGSLREGKFYIGNSGAMKAVPQVGDITVKRINILNHYLSSKGATLLVAGYPIRNGYITGNASQYVLFQEELSEKLKCPVISNYVDYMFDYRYFYDANWHLSSEGAKLRTIQLISDLKQYSRGDSKSDVHNDKYVDIISDVNLPHINDFYEYIDVLKNARNRYTIFVSCMKDVSLGRNDVPGEMLRLLGLSTDNSPNGHYAAVIENGNLIQEAMQHERVELLGEIDNGRMKYSVSCDGQGRSSIRLNGEECSENVKGLNIVVYSNETHRRLDEVGFDFSPTGKIQAHRFIFREKP